MSVKSLGWMQDVGVTCSECGEACEIDGRFTEVAGDERLNFYKVMRQKGSSSKYLKNLSLSQDPKMGVTALS